MVQHTAIHVRGDLDSGEVEDRRGNAAQLYRRDDPQSLGEDTIESYAEGIASFNFIGHLADGPTTGPSIFAVILEVAIWSFAGVLARLEYNLAQIVLWR